MAWRVRGGAEGWFWRPRAADSDATGRTLYQRGLKAPKYYTFYTQSPAGRK